MTIRDVHSPKWKIGTNAERSGLSPASEAVGLKFYETDTSDLFYWNGTSWVEYSSGAAGSITVEEQDGVPSVAATTIKVNNGRLTDDGGGTVSIDLYDDTDWATAFAAADLADIGTAEGEDVALADAGGYFTTDNVEAALQQLGAWIDQDVTIGSSPTLDGTNFTGIPDGALDTDYVEVAGDTMTGALTIQTSDESTELTLEVTTATANRYPGFMIRNYTNGNSGHPVYYWHNSGGTSASPATLGTDVTVGLFVARAHTGTAFRDVGRFGFKTGPNFAEGDREGYFYLALGDATGYGDKMRIQPNGNFGIATTAPGQIFDINQGSGNMIADGYDTHSLSEYKQDIRDAGAILDKLIKAKPKRYKRQVHVAADELKNFAVKKFGVERWIVEFGGYQDEFGNLHDDDYRRGKMLDMKDKELQKAIDDEAARLRKERETEERWSRERLGMIADDPDTFENLPEIVARDYESGEPKGISLVDWIAALHAGLIELNEKVDRGQIMAARVER